MQCKNCGHPHSEVIYTRHDEKNNITNRRRECLDCGLRYTTTENFKEFKKNKTDELIFKSI